MASRRLYPAFAGNLRPFGPERPRVDCDAVAGRATESYPVDLTGPRCEAGSHTEAPIAPDARPFGAPVAPLGRGLEAWIGSAEVADRLKVSRATVYAPVKPGQLGRGSSFEAHPDDLHHRSELRVPGPAVINAGSVGPPGHATIPRTIGPTSHLPCLPIDS